MATQYEQITERLASFVREQQMFFVATAARDGRVNLSPKGLDSLRVLGPNRVVWLNGTGSGNETAAHLLDSPRIALFPPMAGARNVFDVDVDLVQTSCGFGVPLFEYQEQRTLMRSWAENKGDAGVRAYQQEKNRFSIDGCPAGLPG